MINLLIKNIVIDMMIDKIFYKLSIGFNSVTYKLETGQYYKSMLIIEPAECCIYQLEDVVVGRCFDGIVFKLSALKSYKIDGNAFVYSNFTWYIEEHEILEVS